MKSLKDHALALIGIVFLSVVGCSSPKHVDPTSLVIVPGLGISNVVALGMTVGEIRRNVPDMDYNKGPVRMPWQDEYVGRLPWEKPRWHGAAIPSLGVSFSAPYYGKGSPYYGFINFSVVASPNTPQFRFKGSLSCGLSFADGQTVSRKDIVSVFGEPSLLVRMGDTNISHLMRSGVNFSLVCPDEREVFYYPTNGIWFDLNDGIVIRVAVWPKQTGQTTP